MGSSRRHARSTKDRTAPAHLFSGALEESFAAYRIGRALHATWPKLARVEGNDGTFDFDGFAGAGHCTRAVAEGPYLEAHTHWSAPFLVDPSPEETWTPPYVARATPKRGDGSLSCSTANGVYEVGWQDQRLVVAVAKWSEGMCNHFHWWVLASEREIVEDFRTFLSAREDYARLGVPWKRGVLLLGPPGNGKTHCLRGVLGMLDLPTLYVQSFRSRYDTDERNIEEVFDRARRIAPCVVVFEDLDAQITPRNRSFFLNQLDGFAPNAGLLVLATTNHPERLDPAIIERPSRFDRKYHFPLPGPEGRAEFLARWTERLDRHLKLTREQLATLVEGTDGFSFAYLKELCLSTLLRWMKQRPADGLYPIFVPQLEVLRAQMRSEQEQAAGKPETADGKPNGAMRDVVAALAKAFAGVHEGGGEDEA